MSVASKLGSDLVLWLDLRSGHAANLSGNSAGDFDGTVNGTHARFRTGYGFETTHDYSLTGDIHSLGYIRVADNAAFTPPVGGMCLVASYMQTSIPIEGVVICHGDDRFSPSWRLMRTATEIQFHTHDGAGASSFAYAIAAVPGQIETIAVRYLGGVDPNNCIIAVIAPVPSSSTGQISRVPQDSTDPLSVCAISNSPVGPLVGTMRYVAFIRGAQSNAIITDLIIEMEGRNWPNELALRDQSGSVADRSVQYMSKFGVSASIADEGGTVNGELSNSRWSFRDANTLWRVQPLHTAHAAVGSSADICKALMCHAVGLLELPSDRFAVGVTPTIAAFGTWDFWVLHADGEEMDTWLVHTMAGVNNYGYYVTVDATSIYLRYSDAAGAVTDLLTAANVVAGTQVVRIRVTRTSPAGVWKLFYQVESTTGTPDKWRQIAGSATEVTLTTSDEMMLDYPAGCALLLGNHRSEKAFYKWKGVVNPL
jgi:hypothetical protein